MTFSVYLQRPISAQARGHPIFGGDFECRFQCQGIFDTILSSEPLSKSEIDVYPSSFVLSLEKEVLLALIFAGFSRVQNIPF